MPGIPQLIIYSIQQFCDNINNTHKNAPVANIVGLIHYQNALRSGNASLVIPLQQIPQQLAPIPIYYFVFNLSSPKPYSLYVLSIGIILIVFSGFILAQRQAALEQIGSKT